jgi:hypothetical protein
VDQVGRYSLLVNEGGARAPRASDVAGVGRGTRTGVPSGRNQPGDRNRPGQIMREGAPVVRRLVAEAVWQTRRRSPAVRAYFERVQRGDPQRKKIALVATAHYLVRVMWALLKRGTVWEGKPAMAK